MQIPILNGIYTSNKADFRISYPRNMIPVPLPQGVSSGYLRPAEGIDELSDIPGIDRGGINWNGSCYRSCGTSLVKVSPDGSITTLGSLPGSETVSMDYSFDRLAVVAGGGLFYYTNEGSFTAVTDPDLGHVFDLVWVDGYFMMTDGEFIIVTELSDPTQINPLKYGSSEADPDNINRLLKIRNEIYVVNRYTIEVFSNVGGSNFPFQRIEGAQTPKGSLSTRSCCIFSDTIAMVGGGKNEPLAVWQSIGGESVKISTREIEKILHEFTEEQLSTDLLLEHRLVEGHSWLYLHLPNATWVYDASASAVIKEPVWFSLSSAYGDSGRYHARNHVWCYDKWIVGHPTSPKLGTLTYDHGDHWGDPVRWEFATSIIYNNGAGALFHELELVSLTGETSFGDDPMISTAHSIDGRTFSQQKYIKASRTGDRQRRLIWFRQGRMRNWRIQKFTGDSRARISPARLEAKLEPLLR